ncbi:hypothetical protein FXF51_22525 [Nonomuraea sp. PA05]|uniref:hypothetical protein n=1 Tax=Nonomuraea sp. PA05 TaxID=2604466 RepID=UPI0011DBE07E|nr:hypothetical protein [Nonomuraea sp. PA05]TYB63844.1 hypothetical protein FXF51_22525 [Nonomuraea sp. PA05]
MAKTTQTLTNRTTPAAARTTTRTFLLASAGSALGLAALCALPAVGGFLLDRAVAATLVFPGLGQGRAAGTAVTLGAFCVMLTGGAYLAYRWSGFGESRVGLLVCWGLAGGPAGVLAVLLWARGHRLPSGPYVTDAASWGMAIALPAAGLALAGTRMLPAAGRERTRTFRPRAWVLPCLVAGWSLVWSVLLRERLPLLGWLPLSFSYFEQVAVVLATIAAASLEGALRRRLPVEGRPGRAFVLAWIALSVAPVVYAAVVAIDLGMRESLLTAPLGTAWMAEYATDMTAVLVAAPAQTALPPLLLALAATGVQRVLRAEPAPVPADPVRTDRRWGLLVAGAAVALTYFCLAVTSRFTLLTRRTFDADTPVTVRALALLAPPDPGLGRVAVVWSWAIPAVFAVAAAVLVYVAVRGQLVRVFPVSAYPVLVAAVALAAALAWNVGGLAGLVLTGGRPAGISPAVEAAEFTVFAAPVFAAVLFIVHSQVGVTRFARVVELEGEQKWEKLAERYRAWREQVRGHVPGRRERGLIAARAAGGALVLAVVAGAVQGFGGPVDPGPWRGSGVFLAFPVLSAGVPVADNLTGLAYLVLLGVLVYVGLARVNVAERRWAVWSTVWGMSVLAGVAAGLGTPAGLQLGLLAGPFAVAGVAVTTGRKAQPDSAAAVTARRKAQPGSAAAVAVPRKVLLVGGLVLTVPAAAPLVFVTGERHPLAITTETWQERLPGLTIDVSYPSTASAQDASRVSAALAAPVRAYVTEALRRHRMHPTTSTTTLTGGYALVRNDAHLISVRYALTGELGRAVTYDRRAGRTLTVRDVFAPQAFTPAGRRRLAEVLRPLAPKGHDPRTVSVDSDRLLVNLAPGAVELTFGRDYFCVPCAPFTARVPGDRLAGLVIRRP